MQEFSSYFKYCSDNSGVIEGIFKLHKIRFTQPWGMNDPLEFNPTIKFQSFQVTHQYYRLDEIVFPSIELFYRTQIIESQINLFGILSLTKTPFSFDMWSKYANGHKGFVLEFKNDFIQHSCMKSKNNKINTLKKVEYMDEYSINFESLFDNNGVILTPALHNELFFKKTARWKDEKEYRLVRPLIDSADYSPPANDTSYRDDKVYLFDFSLDCISAITFGANMSIENKKIIADCCSHQDIQLFQAYIIRNDKDELGLPSRVDIISIKHLDSKEELYQFQPQGFCLDKERISKENIENNNIQIKKLNDLPYYQGNEEIIEEFIKNNRKTI